MLERNEKESSTRIDRPALAKQTRAMLMMGALCCLSIGIAIGALLRGGMGVATATLTDNRLTISNAPTTPDSLSLIFAKVAAQVEPCVVNIKVSDNEDRAFAREGGRQGRDDLQRPELPSPRVEAVCRDR